MKTPRLVLTRTVGLCALVAAGCQSPDKGTGSGAGAGNSDAGGQGTGGAGHAGGAGGAGGAGAGGAGGAGCADAIIALDRSCSMVNKPRGFTKSKYAVAEEILTALTADYDTRMAFGLNAFPPLPNEGTKCDAGRVYVDMGLGTAGRIASAIQAIDPTLPANKNCGTPTAADLEMLVGYAPLLAPGRKHNVILLTDGMPVCNGETVPRSVAAIGKLRSLGVSTFVVGYVAGANVSALNMMADAGGQPQPPPAPTRFYNAAAPDELNFTLRKILNTICSDIPPPSCPTGVSACGSGGNGAPTCPAETNCSGGCCFPVIR